ncbi:hypothetical protein BS78_03G353400 [Paspalum vaginatum]|nr:hypothetical protein BS78_03G353400 [Paspalum vaginatum]
MALEPTIPTKPAVFPRPGTLPSENIPCSKSWGCNTYY